MGPPEKLRAAEDGLSEKGLLMYGDVGELVGAYWVDGGTFSQDRVRRHDCRIMEYEAEASG